MYSMSGVIFVLTLVCFIDYFYQKLYKEKFLSGIYEREKIWISYEMNALCKYIHIALFLEFHKIWKKINCSESIGNWLKMLI